MPRYDIQAAAGHGQLVGDEQPMFAMAFRRYWIENYVTRDIKNLSVISVKGDSMEGVLNDGDTILINHGQTTPRDGLYVLRLNENLLVKRLQLIPGGIVNVISANEAYPTFEIDLKTRPTTLPSSAVSNGLAEASKSDILVLEISAMPSM